MTETIRNSKRVLSKWFLAVATINKAVLLAISGTDITENPCGLYLERSSIPGAFQAIMLFHLVKEVRFSI
jgi:hypothetical protein